LVSELDVRLTIINAVLRDVTTKSYMEALRKEFEEEIGRLEGRIDGLEQRIDQLKHEPHRRHSSVSRPEPKPAKLVDSHPKARAQFAHTSPFLTPSTFMNPM
jgi:hypothetical protein